MLSSVEPGENIQFANQDVNIELDNRIEKISQWAIKFFTSQVVIFFSTMIGSIILFSALNLTCVGLLLTGGVGLYIYLRPYNIPKNLIYELAIMKNIVANYFSCAFKGKTSYYHQILPNIYLGALPLKTSHHDKILLQDLNIKSVLSLVEDFEFEKETFFSFPVTKKMWKDHKINQLSISVVDHSPLTIDELHKSADFIEACEKPIYIHCKSGMGRAPSALLAYLIKYKNKTLEEGLALIQAIRSIRLNSLQKMALKNFEIQLRS